jgi:hypothetical protein
MQSLSRPASRRLRSWQSGAAAIGTPRDPDLVIGIARRATKLASRFVATWRLRRIPWLMLPGESRANATRTLRSGPAGA